MEGVWRKALRDPCKPASLWMRPCTSDTHRPEEGREWGASRFYFPRLQSRFSFLTSWWIFRGHATISKSYYHRTENNPQIIMSLCLLFLFENLESLEGAFEKKKNLYPSWKSHQWATVGMLVTPVHGARQRANTRVKAPPPNKEKRYFLMPHRLQSDTAIISLLRHSYITKAFT